MGFCASTSKSGACFGFWFSLSLCPSLSHPLSLSQKYTLKFFFKYIFLLLLVFKVQLIFLMPYLANLINFLILIYFVSLHFHVYFNVSCESDCYCCCCCCFNFYFSPLFLSFFLLNMLSRIIRVGPTCHVAGLQV